MAIKNEIKNLKTYLVEMTVTFKIDETPYTPLRRTRKICIDKIFDFMNYIASLWIIYVHIRTNLISIISKLDIYKDVYKTNFESILNEYFKKNEIISSSLLLCINEFANYLYELQVGTYSGAARTLRYILETAIDACEFQTDKKRLRINDLINKATSKDDIKSFLEYNNSQIAFLERYKIYEKTKRIAPTFRELINELNSREIFSESPKISDTFKQLYEKLSDYVHPSLKKIESHIKKPKMLLPNYIEEEFFNIYELSLQVIDVVQFLFIKTLYYYNNFKNGKDFLNDLSKNIKIQSSLKNYFLVLPYTKKLSKNIKWEII